MDLKNYDGKIYLVRDKFALKFKNGSFHYVEKECLFEAFKQNFPIGYDKETYDQMPWGLQHTGYVFEESASFKDKFINEVILEYVNRDLIVLRQWLDKMYISRDDESLEIGIKLSDDSDPIVICYWHADEWFEDPETVIPAMLQAQELFYTDIFILLDTLGYVIKD